MREALRRMTFRGWLNLGAGLGLLLLLAYAASVLSRSPCLGVADILDFWRVMRPAGLEHVSPLEHPGYYARCEFQAGEADLLSAPSSSAFLVWVARHVSWGLSPEPERSDLRQVGLLYLVIVAVILAFGLAAGLSPVVALLLLYVLADPGYLLFLNSFYADATLIVALLGVAVCLERRGEVLSKGGKWGQLRWLGWAFMLGLFALLGGGSKMQYVFLPIFVLLALLPQLLRGLSESHVRALGLGAALVLIFSAVLWNFFFGPGPRFLEYNNYHAVYGGVMKVTSEPEKALRQLGVPEAFHDLPRTDAWSAGVGLDHAVHPHLRDLSRLDLLKLYLSDPAALRATFREVAARLAKVESHPRGTQVRDPNDRGPIKRTYQVPWQYSRLSRLLLGAHPGLIWWLITATSLWLLTNALARRWNGARTALLFLLLWSTSQIAVAVLGEGFINLHQHLLGARLGLDLVVVFLVADGVGELDYLGGDEAPRGT